MSPAAGSLLVDDAEARRSVAELARAQTVALDTEGDGMFRYRARLCTVQLAGEGKAHVFDTLVLDANALFGALLGAHGPRKIVHDVSFDARMLFAEGIALGNVFDTAIAARFLGYKSTGLSSLLAQLFQLNLPKHKQQADWGERPLDDEAIAYLHDDVRHLEALADALRAQLIERDIAEEVDEECRYMLGEAQQPARELSPFMRIKGAVLRLPRERARLYELAIEREAIAALVDLPPTRLITNDQLLAVVERELKSQSELMQALPARVSAHGARLWDALLRAEARPDAPEREVRELTPRVPSPAELERKKRRRRLLMEFRAREAEARGVDLQVVLPGHCLSDLVDLDTLDVDALTAVRGFGACRVARYGAPLVQELTPGW